MPIFRITYIVLRTGQRLTDTVTASDLDAALDTLRDQHGHITLDVARVDDA